MAEDLEVDEWELYEALEKMQNVDIEIEKLINR